MPQKAFSELFLSKTQEYKWCRVLKQGLGVVITHEKVKKVIRKLFMSETKS